MPLRDHLRPPVWNLASWEGFHGGWPMVMVQHLARDLPAGFTAEPRVHLGTNFEIDICAYETDLPRPAYRGGRDEPAGGVATATWAPPEPTLSVEVLPEKQYEYEVLVYDQERGRVLVAAVEIVSPGNKDRPENRRMFVAKCAALLQKGVCVSIVDLVTTRHFNLYVEPLELMGQADPKFTITSPATYAATCYGTEIGGRPSFRTWAYPLVVGQPLPTLPVWLASDLVISLELEPSYEETCRVLRIP